MDYHQKERLLNLIQELKNTTFWIGSDSERLEVEIYVLQGRLEKLKLYVKRIENSFIKEQISEIRTDFEPFDRVEAIRQFNKVRPFLEEIEDYLLQENYEAISGFLNENTSNESKIVISENEKIEKELLQAIRKEISTGDLGKAIESLIAIKDNTQFSIDNLILIQNRIATINSEYNKGLISIEVFLRLNTKTVISVITELNELNKRSC